MIHFDYSPNLTGLNILKTVDEQYNKFFYKGHPEFLIPDFNSEPSDIHVSYLDYIESKFKKDVYDQDGGEISFYKLTDITTGLTKCVWTSYGVQLNEDSDPEDLIVEIIGYVIEDQNGETYFLATKVFEDSNILQ